MAKILDFSQFLSSRERLNSRVVGLSKMTEYEQKYVLDFYDKVGEKFSATRYSLWSCVREHLLSLPATDSVFEAGCGNGKNFIRPNMCGIDTCQTLVDICKKRQLDVKYGSIMSIDYPDNQFDHSICIAVIHHLSTEERRKQAIKELVRVTKPGGTIFIYVWALDSRDEHNKKKIYHEQDNLIPFDTEMRYCHLFVEGELETLINDFDVKIEKSFYEQGNFGIIVTKLSPPCLLY